MNLNYSTNSISVGGWQEMQETHLSDVGWDQVADELLHVVVDGASLFHRRHDRREVVVSQNHLGRRLGHGGSWTHSDTDLSFLQRRRVVHTVTSLHRMTSHINININMVTDNVVLQIKLQIQKKNTSRKAI